MKLKTLLTWSPREKKVRLIRVIWERGIFGQGGYSACFSLALVPKLFQIRRICNDFRLVALGISFHYMRSYGGRFV